MKYTYKIILSSFFFLFLLVFPVNAATFTDDFNRTNGEPLGSEWGELQGDCSISSSQAELTSTFLNIEAAICLKSDFDPVSSDLTMSADVLKTTSDGAVGLSFFFQNDERHYSAVIDTSSGKVILYKYTGFGTSSVVAEFSGSYVNDVVYNLKVQTFGDNIKVFVDDVLRIDEDDSTTHSYLDIALFSTSSDAFIDNFNVIYDDGITPTPTPSGTVTPTPPTQYIDVLPDSDIAIGLSQYIRLNLLFSGITLFILFYFFASHVFKR